MHLEKLTDKSNFFSFSMLFMRLLINRSNDDIVNSPYTLHCPVDVGAKFMGETQIPKESRHIPFCIICSKAAFITLYLVGDRRYALFAIDLVIIKSTSRIAIVISATRKCHFNDLCNPKSITMHFFPYMGIGIPFAAYDFRYISAATEKLKVSSFNSYFLNSNAYNVPEFSVVGSNLKSQVQIPPVPNTTRNRTETTLQGMLY
uniref:Uncharacterized protein n=1 Tax=Vespula pensylvanica TaxID=30213 RepID=A0A834PFF9_VESPE|nr:hypothetical protein H0235_001061 [Vespula pensylvanica]